MKYRQCPKAFICAHTAGLTTKVYGVMLIKHTSRSASSLGTEFSKSQSVCQMLMTYPSTGCKGMLYLDQDGVQDWQAVAQTNVLIELGRRQVLRHHTSYR